MNSNCRIDFDNIFVSGTPLIDVRAPIEFDAGHFRSSTNLPILENEERRLVGTCYREKGANEAIQLGHELVQGQTKSERIKRWTDFLKSNPSALLYCYRGGLRSKISTEWLKESGFEVQRIEGGYKALRNHLLLRLHEISTHATFLLVGGKTGSGKTAFLKECGSPHVDLEALANHRGSSFGSMGAQPAQASFENALSTELLKMPAGTPILLEDESVMIGSLIVPETLFSRMKQSRILLLEVEIGERVRNLTREYVLKKIIHDQEPKEQVRDFFLGNLKRIQRKLGGLKHSEIEKMIRSAFDSKDFAFSEAHHDWVEALLVHYYDPLYEKSIDRARDRILIRGDRNELASRLKLP
jgi:tRNA 2-selenouridine synthase